MSLCALVCEGFAGTISVNPGQPQTAPGKLAVKELQLYLGKMFKGKIELALDGGKYDVVIGTGKNNPLIKQAGIKLPTGKYADQGYAIKTIGKTIYIAGSTETGVLYGVYGFLEEYGAYFQITGDYLPRESRFKVKQLDISIAPVFKYRGLMPWDNFLCGMSGYNEEDSFLLIERATRMKLNKLDLHFYPGYVMYNEVWNGKPVNPGWVAQPNEFVPKGRPGEKAFAGMQKMCVRPWEENRGNPRKQADACQQMFRNVIDYAHDHGWVTVCGFSLMQPRGGDFEMTDKPGGPGAGGLNQINPLSGHNAEQNVKRYRRLTEIYPNADYYWMWQHEGGGPMCRNVGREPGAKEMREKNKHWGDPHRAGDIDYAYMFREVAKRLTKEERSKLSMGGWDIQHIFPGIHNDFPKELVFASLNNAYPHHAVKEVKNYSPAREGRRMWMISWWEFDGNQWFPQFRSSWHEKMYKAAYELGVEGISQLGWKLSAIEHHPRYMAEFSWNPGLTYKDFYRGFVRKIYGKNGADEIAKLYGIYDEWEIRTPAASPGDYRPMLLGAGWCSLALPDVPFSRQGLKAEEWKETVRRAKTLLAKQRELMDEDIRSIAVLDAVMSKLTESGQDWAGLLKNRLEFRVLFLKATRALNRSFVTYDEIGNRKGLIVGAKAARKHAGKSLEFAAAAINKYAEECRNRGDLGVIGQMNVQFYDIIAGLDSKFSLESPYVTVDWERFSANKTIVYDFTDPKCWPLRDGVVKVEPFVEEGKEALRVSIGGEKGINSNSLWINRGKIDLEKSPYMDFYIRTSTKDPVCFMFQIRGRDEWLEMDIVPGNTYTVIDRIDIEREINNGKWRRVTWNIRKLAQERIGKDVTMIKGLIIGSWKPLEKPVVLEFRNFNFGKMNLLDGLELDNTK